MLATPGSCSTDRSCIAGVSAGAELMLADTDDQMIKLQVIYSTNFTALPAAKCLGEAEIL